MWAFIRLGRPIFLLGGFVLYGLGVLWAWRARGTFHFAPFVLGQLTITSAQLMTHYANDYFDLAADRANGTPTRWSGGSRVLVEGLLPPRVALRAALSFAALAIAWGSLAIGTLPFNHAGVLGLLLAVIVLAWSYSAPPLRLNARGAGEVTTATVVTVLTPLVGFHLQSPSFDPALLLTLGAVALLQVAMLFAINFPDAEGDRATGKNTWVVRLGTSRAVVVCRALLGAWLLYLPILVVLLPKLGRPWQIALGPTACAPLVIWQLFSLGAVTGTSSRRFAGIAFRGVATLFLASSATLLAVAAAPWP